jgi:hypothetical protein
MSFTKTILVVVGIAFGFATGASAAPRMVHMAAQTTDIPGKLQQDRFSGSYY